MRPDKNVVHPIPEITIEWKGQIYDHTDEEVYYAEALQFDLAVLGRGYSPDEAKADWIRRAKLDGYKFK